VTDNLAERLSARRALRPLLFIASYIALAKLTESFTLDSGFSPWYPPAGLAMAYLLVLGPWAAPTVLAARWINTLVVFPDAWSDEPDGVIVRGLAIVATYATAAWILRRVGLRRARLRELGWFAAVAVIAAPLVASFAVALVDLALEGGEAGAAFEAAWTFWVGDAVAVATIVPAVLLVVASLAGQVRPPRLPQSRTERLEAFLQSLALIVAPVLALSIADRNEATGFLVFAIVPVIWVALRRDLVLAAVGLLVLNVALSVVAGITLGATADLSELQAVMLATALAGLYIAAVTHTQEMAVADLLDSEARYRSLLEAAPDLVARLHLDGSCVASSEPQWAVEVGGADTVIDALKQACLGAGRAVLLDGAPRTVELSLRTPTGDRHLLARLVAEHTADGRVGGAVAVVSDLTDHRRALDLLDHERRHDPLTGLANRARFLAELGDLAAGGGRIGLTILDLDGFLAVNELFGSERGDGVLREVADRLRRVVGSSAVVGRLGADQFAVACYTDEITAAALGRDLVQAMRIRVADGDQALYLTGSAGMAVADDPDPSVLLRDADNALHAAKDSGRDQVVVVDEARRAATLDRQGSMAQLRRCLAAQDIVVHYQPIVDLSSGAVLGLEALVRLPAPDGDGLLYPAAFLALAEESGLDVELGTLVLERAVQQLAAVQADPSLVTVQMSVNVTARQLAQPGFVHLVLAACTRHGIDPSCIRLELTETLVMADPAAATSALRELRAMGISAALDDFGVGYSSMVYLRRLPVDVLKIDRAFVSGLPDDTDDRSIVSLMVGLADALGLDVTAEGIETEAQRVALLELGCRSGQGYLFARPAPVDELVLTRGPDAGARR
jgi:diguanylate cyclase (GGDEF)-like protein